MRHSPLTSTCTEVKQTATILTKEQDVIYLNTLNFVKLNYYSKLIKIIEKLRM